jgi:membrane protein DedA with SNARE-associated domain
VLTLESLIGTHGYWLLALGCLLEGETILVLAGFAAHRGYLNPIAVIAIAAAAGFAGDQFFFWLGRRHGAAVMARWPSLVKQSGRVESLVKRFHATFIIGMRFAYGLRVAGPILLGTTEVSALRFLLLNALGAIIWACLIGGIGWVFGQVAATVMGEIRHIEGWLLLSLVLVAGLVWWWRGRSQRSCGKQP